MAGSSMLSNQRQKGWETMTTNQLLTTITWQLLIACSLLGGILGLLVVRVWQAARRQP